MKDKFWDRAYQLLSDGSLCDIQLCILDPDGSSIGIPAHKLILVTSSSFFQECLLKQNLLDVYHFDGITMANLQVLLDYMYRRISWRELEANTEALNAAMTLGVFKQDNEDPKVDDPSGIMKNANGSNVLFVMQYQTGQTVGKKKRGEKLRHRVILDNPETEIAKTLSKKSQFLEEQVEPETTSVDMSQNENILVNEPVPQSPSGLSEVDVPLETSPGTVDISKSQDIPQHVTGEAMTVNRSHHDQKNVTSEDGHDCLKSESPDMQGLTGSNDATPVWSAPDWVGNSSECSPVKATDEDDKKINDSNSADDQFPQADHLLIAEGDSAAENSHTLHLGEQNFTDSNVDERMMKLEQHKVVNDVNTPLEVSYGVEEVTSEMVSIMAASSAVPMMSDENDGSTQPCERTIIDSSGVSSDQAINRSRESGVNTDQAIDTSRESGVGTVPAVVNSGRRYSTRSGGERKPSLALKMLRKKRTPVSADDENPPKRLAVDIEGIPQSIQTNSKTPDGGNDTKESTSPQTEPELPLESPETEMEDHPENNIPLEKSSTPENQTECVRADHSELPKLNITTEISSPNLVAMETITSESLMDQYSERGLPETFIKTNINQNATNQFSVFTDDSTKNDVHTIHPGVELPQESSSGNTVFTVGTKGNIAVLYAEDGPHICPYCQKIFKNTTGLSIHVQWKHKRSIKRKTDKPQECNICHKVFKSLAGLVGHELRAHNHVRPNACPDCGEEFVKPRQLRRHQVHKHGAAFFKCENCDVVFKSQEGLDRHIKKLHLNEPMIVCDLCGKAFKLKTEFKSHLRNSHSDVRDYPCHLCDRAFKGRSSLTRHLKTYHSNIRNYTCEVCQQKFKALNDLKQHHKKHFRSEKPLGKDGRRVKEHPDGENYPCTYCDKQFTKYSLKSKHEFKQHIERADGTMYLCTICKQSHPTRALLTQHITYKHWPRRYRCPACHREFVHRFMLKNHCEQPGKCRGQPSMPKPFKCYKCGLTFSLKGNLTKHLQHQDRCKEARKKALVDYVVVMGKNDEVPSESVADEIYLPMEALKNFESGDVTEKFAKEPVDTEPGDDAVTYIVKTTDGETESKQALTSADVLAGFNEPARLGEEELVSEQHQVVVVQNTPENYLIGKAVKDQQGKTFLHTSDGQEIELPTDMEIPEAKEGENMIIQIIDGEDEMALVKHD